MYKDNSKERRGTRKKSQLVDTNFISRKPQKPQMKLLAAVNAKTNNPSNDVNSEPQKDFRSFSNLAEPKWCRRSPL